MNRIMKEVTIREKVGYLLYIIILVLIFVLWIFNIEENLTLLFPIVTVLIFSSLLIASQEIKEALRILLVFMLPFTILIITFFII